MRPATGFVLVEGPLTLVAYCLVAVETLKDSVGVSTDIEVV